MQTAAADDRTTCEFYFQTQAAWDAMYLGCEAATRSIDVEQYILTNDAAGGRFLRLFAAKARQGISVRLILDAAGCWGLLSDPAIGDIRAAGGKVYFYNALGWGRIFFPSRWLPRTHIKLMLIDGKTAFTGSTCLREAMHSWHDLHVRLSGRVTRAIREEYERVWTSLEEKRRLPLKEPLPDDFQYVISEPQFGVSAIYREILNRINGARRRIRVVTPYFLPPRRLRRALEGAAARGVQVDILMSSSTDVRLADWAARTYFPRLMRQGLRIFLYEAAVLHGKYVLIDDDWATVGSVNIDYLSLTKNREANLFVRENSVIGQLWSSSDEYLRHATQMDDSQWENMPYLHKIAGRLGRYLMEIL